MPSAQKPTSLAQSDGVPASEGPPPEPVLVVAPPAPPVDDVVLAPPAPPVDVVVAPPPPPAEDVVVLVVVHGAAVARGSSVVLHALDAATAVGRAMAPASAAAIRVDFIAGLENLAQLGTIRSLLRGGSPAAWPHFPAAVDFKDEIPSFTRHRPCPWRFADLPARGAAREALSGC
jgi:hypothetical protein